MNRPSPSSNGFVVVYGVPRQSGKPSVVLEPKGLDPKIEVLRETAKELRFIDRRHLKYSGPVYEPRPQKQKKFMCIGGPAGGQTLARIQTEGYGQYYAFNFAGNRWPIMKFGSRRHNQVYIHESLL